LRRRRAGRAHAGARKRRSHASQRRQYGRQLDQFNQISEAKGMMFILNLSAVWPVGLGPFQESDFSGVRSVPVNV
jgi:hypothetical protein